eukprot:2948147-Pyramimonas_sp.AAC.1
MISRGIWGGLLGPPTGSLRGRLSFSEGLWRASQSFWGASGWPPGAAWCLRPIPPPCLGCVSE